MKNLINWMCLISIMILVLQVMIYMNSEVISDYNKINRKRKLVKKKNVSIENTRFAEYENYYTQKKLFLTLF